MNKSKPTTTGDIRAKVEELVESIYRVGGLFALKAIDPITREETKKTDVQKIVALIDTEVKEAIWKTGQVFKDEPKVEEHKGDWEIDYTFWSGDLGITAQKKSDIGKGKFIPIKDFIAQVREEAVEETLKKAGDWIFSSMDNKGRFGSENKETTISREEWDKYVKLTLSK